MTAPPAWAPRTGSPRSSRRAKRRASSSSKNSRPPRKNGPKKPNRPRRNSRAEAERQAERKAEEAQQAAEKLAEEERLRLSEQAKVTKEVTESEEKARLGNAAEPVTNLSPPTTTANVGALSGVPLRPSSLSAGASSTLVPVLSAPALTRTATAALTHGRPRAARIAFAFTLNTRARVRVTLAKQVTVRGRRPGRWQTLPYSLTIAGARGRDSAHLSSRSALAPGRYRLTFTPAGGLARTLTFQIG